MTIFGPKRTKTYQPSPSLRGAPGSRNPLQKQRARKARVESWNESNGEVTVRFIDKNNNDVMNLDFASSQPYVGLGWGIYCGIEVGSECYVSYDQQGLPYIDSYIMNPLHINSTTMREQAKAFGFPFSGETPLYPVYRVLKEGELAMISRGGTGMFVTNAGDVFVNSPVTGMRWQLQADIRSLILEVSTYQALTDAGNHTYGIIRRPNVLTDGTTQNFVVTKNIAKTGLTPGTDPKTNAVPSDSNPALIERSTTIYETGDDKVGLDTNLVDPIVYTREGTVVANSLIAEEKANNGKMLAHGTEPNSPPAAATQEDLALWFRKTFKRAGVEIEHRIDKQGRIQFHVKNGTKDSANKDISLQAVMGAVFIKLRSATNSKNLSFSLEDEDGNKITFGKTVGFVVDTVDGHKVTLDKQGIIVEDGVNKHKISFSSTGFLLTDGVNTGHSIESKSTEMTLKAKSNTVVMKLLKTIINDNFEVLQ